MIIGNWKMNGSVESLRQFTALDRVAADAAHFVGLALPATLIGSGAALYANVAIGAQGVHHEEKGPFTGAISASMVADAGATFTIVGHSETRDNLGDDDDRVRLKAARARAAGLRTVLCVGERRSIRDEGRAEVAVSSQLESCLPAGFGANQLAVAYEPIWAIGAGTSAPIEAIVDMFSTLRDRLISLMGAPGCDVPLLYGGSVTESNASAVLALAQVDGLLVGGASTALATFMPILAAGIISPRGWSSSTSDSCAI